MSDDRIQASLKHERLKSILLSALEDGEYKPGDRLPSQNEMAEQYQVSHNTVREALASLVHDGLLYRVQGKGAFVADRKQKPIYIAVVMPHIYLEVIEDEIVGADICPRLVNAIEKEARDNGAGVMLYLYNDSAELEVESLRTIVERKTDAAIVFHWIEGRHRQALAEVRDAGIPLVLVDRDEGGLGFDYVGTDNYNGAYRAVVTMAESGLRDIYYLTHSLEVFSSTEVEREQGYRDACGKLGLTPRVLVQNPGNMEGPAHEWLTRRCLEQVDSIRERPFGVFSVNGPVLRWLWAAIEERGIPHSQYALGCFDEPLAAVPDDLYFVKVVQPLSEIGRLAVQTALSRRKGTAKSRRMVLDPAIKISNGTISFSHGA